MNTKIQPLIRNRPFIRTDFTDGSTSLITCFQTLEHVFSPLEMVDDIYKLLTPGGGVFFVAHNYKSIINRLLSFRSPIYDIEHLQLFSKKSLYLLLKTSGFKNIKIFSITNHYPLSYWVRLFPLPSPIKQKLHSLLTQSICKHLSLSFRVGNLGIIGFKE